MPFVNYTWINNPLHKRYRIYYSDTEFDSTTLPTTYDEINPADGVNTKNVYAEYRSKMYSMFEATDSTDNVAYGELMRVTTLENFVVVDKAKIIILNNNFDIIESRDMPNNVYRLGYDSESDKIFALTVDPTNNKIDFYCLKPTDLSTVWVHENLPTEHFADMIADQYILLRSTSKTKMLFVDGYVYLNTLDRIVMFKIDGTESDDFGTTEKRIGYTFPISMTEGVDFTLIQDFDISDDGTVMFILANNGLISRFSRNYTDHFHISNNTTDAINTQIAFAATQDRGTNIFIMNASNSNVIVTHGDSDTTVISEYNIETESLTEKTNWITNYDANTTSCEILSCVKKYGRLYMTHMEYGDTSGINGTVFSIIELDAFTVPTSTMFNKFAEKNDNVMFTFGIGVFGDKQTFIAHGERMLLNIFDPVENEMFNNTAYYTMDFFPVIAVPLS